MPITRTNVHSGQVRCIACGNPSPIQFSTCEVAAVFDETSRSWVLVTAPDAETNALDALRTQADAAAAEFARRFDAGEFVWNDDDTLTVLVDGAWPSASRS